MVLGAKTIINDTAAIETQSDPRLALQTAGTAERFQRDALTDELRIV